MLASVGTLMLASIADADGSPIALTPSIDFGRAVAGSGTYTKFVEVYNGTTSSLQVVSPQPGVFGDFSVGASGDCPRPPSVSTLAPGATCSMTVEYTPAALGPQAVNAGVALCDVNDISISTNPDGTKSGTCPAQAALIVPFAVTGSGVAADTLTAGPQTLSFGLTPQQTLGAAETVTLTNGSEPTSITGLSKSGPAADDFVIGNDGCTGATLVPHASCTFNVRFAPSRIGERDATLGVEGATLGNAYPTLSLSGTGGSVPTQPPGQNGATGPTGKPGPAGPKSPPGGRAPAGHVEIVTCRAGTTTTRGRKRTVNHCRVLLVSSPATFTIRGVLDRAIISRGRRVYATGSSSSTGGGLLLLMHSGRPLRPGGYTLTLRRGTGAGRVLRRLQIWVS
jgi:hypothetical protein